MSDRHRTLTVLLDGDYREEDLDSLCAAIGAMRSVERVRVGAPVGPGDLMAREIARIDLRRKILEKIQDMLAPGLL